MHPLMLLRVDTARPETGIPALWEAWREAALPIVRTLGEVALAVLLVLLAVRLLGQVRWFTRGTRWINGPWSVMALGLGLASVAAGTLRLSGALGGQWWRGFEFAALLVMVGPFLLWLGGIPSFQERLRRGWSALFQIEPRPSSLDGSPSFWIAGGRSRVWRWLLGSILSLSLTAVLWSGGEMLQRATALQQSALQGLIVVLAGLLVLSRAIHGSGPCLRFNEIAAAKDDSGIGLATRIEAAAYRVATDAGPNIAWAGRPDVAIDVPTVVGEIDKKRLAALAELIRRLVPDRSYQVEGVLHPDGETCTLLLTRGNRLVSSCQLFEGFYNQTQAERPLGLPSQTAPVELERAAGVWLLFSLHQDFFGRAPEGFGTDNWESAINNLDGEDAAKHDRPDEARCHFLQALDQDPFNDDARFNYARFLIASSTSETCVEQHEYACRELEAVNNHAEKAGNDAMRLRCCYWLTAANLHLYLSRHDRAEAEEDLTVTRRRAEELRKARTAVDKQEQLHRNDPEWENLRGSMEWILHAIDQLYPATTTPLGQGGIGTRGPGWHGRSHRVRYNIACSQALIGVSTADDERLAAAIEELRPVALGRSLKGWRTHDPSLDVLKDDRRFLELLRSVDDKVVVPDLSDLEMIGPELARRLAMHTPPITDVGGLAKALEYDPRGMNAMLGVRAARLAGGACELIQTLPGVGIHRANMLVAAGVGSLADLAAWGCHDTNGEKLFSKIRQLRTVTSRPTPHTVQCWIHAARGQKLNRAPAHAYHRPGLDFIELRVNEMVTLRHSEVAPRPPGMGFYTRSLRG